VALDGQPLGGGGAGAWTRRLGAAHDDEERAEAARVRSEAKAAAGAG
jgi:hypothetical protein